MGAPGLLHLLRQLKVERPDGATRREPYANIERPQSVHVIPNYPKRTTT